MKSSINRWRRAVLRGVLGDNITAGMYGRKLASRLHAGVATGLTENATLDYAEKLVASGDVVLDVGALGGDWLIWDGKWAPKGLCLASRPMPFLPPF